MAEPRQQQQTRPILGTSPQQQQPVHAPQHAHAHGQQKPPSVSPLAYRLAYFSRFFRFPQQRAYLVVGALMLTHGIAQGYLAWSYVRDPEGTKLWLAQLPARTERWLAEINNRLEQSRQLRDQKRVGRSDVVLEGGSGNDEK